MLSEVGRSRPSNLRHVAVRRRRLLTAAGWWSVGYAAVLLTMQAAGAGTSPFPGTAAGQTAHLLLVAACFLLAVAARWLATGDRASRRTPGWLKLGLWASSVLLVVVVPTNLVMQLAFAAVGDAKPLALHLLALTGGLLWTAATLAVQRNSSPGCASCGRTRDLSIDDGWVHPPPRLKRTAVAASAVALLGFTLPHWLWASGVPVGTVETKALADVTGSLWVLGAVPALGAALTMGLVQRWGQVLPERLPVLGGRRVPRWCAILPALLVATLLLQYGVMMTSCAAATILHATQRCFTADRTYLLNNWAFTATYPVFLTWGLLLGISALGYQSITRDRCRVCGRR